MSSRIKVVTRTRPSVKFADELIKFPSDGKTISVNQPLRGNHGYINNQPSEWAFSLDKVLHNSSQEDVYDSCARNIVTKTLEGFNGTIMAYGQTGAGKTFTMTGHTENYKLRGIIPRAISQVFQEIRTRPDLSVSVRVSFVEIYNEIMSDLLTTLTDGSAQQLNVVENEHGGVYVKGLTSQVVHTEEEALNLLFEGETNRAVGTHTLNKSSSRSHCIFTIYVETRSRVESNASYTSSKLNLVDLAGSERLGKTNSEGVTQKEAMYINKSLTFLEQVVLALADRKRDHIPYRQSKLTHMLKDSLGGGCNTLLIANIWGEAAQLEETISTLRFATRMMCISSEPVQNVLQDPMLLLKQYEQEIKSLKQELAMHNTLANRTSVTYEPLSETEIQDIQRQVKLYMDGTIQEIELLSVRQIRETLNQFRLATLVMQDELADKMKSLQLQSRTSLVTTSQSPQPDRRVSKASRTSKMTMESSVSEEIFVGDTDGQGFNLGVAPSSLKTGVSSVAATKKLKKKSRAKSPTEEAVIKETPLEVPEGPVVVSEHSSRPNTPPPKEEAFEMFKKDKGKELNTVLLQNKEILRQKRKFVNERSITLNKVKQKIDEVCKRLEQREKEKQEHGELMTSEGHVVIEEEEYLDITELKRLKLEYRGQHEEIQDLKREMSHCEKFVDQSRQHLVKEFEKWYKVSFLGEQEIEVETESDKRKKIVESDAEVFDKLQRELLNDEPDALGFYQARVRTDMRSNYPAKVRPGSITQKLRNKPPTSMTLS